MLSRVSALWLIVLILLPFSAPFETCDLASVLPVLSQRATSPRHTPAPVKARGEVAHSVALPLTRVVARIRFAPSKERTTLTDGLVVRTATATGPLHRHFVRSSILSPLRI